MLGRGEGGCYIFLLCCGEVRERGSYPSLLCWGEERVMEEVMFIFAVLGRGEGGSYASLLCWGEVMEEVMHRCCVGER